MPLKVIPPRNKKTDHLYIRGTYLGVSVDRSAVNVAKMKLFGFE